MRPLQGRQGRGHLIALQTASTPPPEAGLFDLVPTGTARADVVQDVNSWVVISEVLLRPWR